MPILDATIGGVRSNSYLTHTEANEYFSERLPISPPWVASGEEGLLIMATRTLNALAQPFKTLFPGPPAYYRIRREWTGLAATTTQRLAWPRIQMFDHNGYALDIAIVSVSATDPAVVTTSSPHNLLDGQEVLLFGIVDCVPDVNGPQNIGYVSRTSFTIPVAVTTAGRDGRVTTIPRPLKEATAELAGQLLKEDRILDNDIIMQGINSIRAGSVALGFNKDIIQQVIPQAVYDMMPYSWLTDELYEPAVRALFDLASE